MPNSTLHLSSFNKYTSQKCAVVRPERYQELRDIVKGPLIARGEGGSYGDAALNSNGQVTLMQRLNRVLEFDRTQGIIVAEAGITLAELLTIIVPAGWFLPVTPGTQWVSLGGCIAANVHGKNHHYAGAISQFVVWLDVIIANGEIIRCSAQQNPDLFWVVIAGMGLTGIIGSAALQLIPIQSAYMRVTQEFTPNLEQTLKTLTHPQYNNQYSVAWLDTLNTGDKFTRGIIMNAQHATLDELNQTQKNHPFNSKKTSIITVPAFWPAGLLNQSSVKLYNNFYFHYAIRKANFITHYQNYFYSLDKIKHWPRLYGKNGFVQYQCVLPHEKTLSGFNSILEQLKTHSCLPFLTVLKQLGHADKAPLSFPMPGFTLAMDIPLSNKNLFAVLDKLDEIVLANNGRIYLAKDARITTQTFKKMYPDFSKWLTIKKQIDPDNIFNSNLSARLDMNIFNQT